MTVTAVVVARNMGAQSTQKASKGNVKSLVSSIDYWRSVVVIKLEDMKSLSKIKYEKLKSKYKKAIKKLSQ